MRNKSFLEIQFPIAPISLESYKERKAVRGKILASLGKWWGSKPIVLTRAIILGIVFPASNDSDKWPDDLDIFLKCMCLDNAGMWKRKIKSLPASLCYPVASYEERENLFINQLKWRRTANRRLKLDLEKKVFYSLGHAKQREFCCRVEEVDGPPKESWQDINTHLGTTASSLQELVQQLSQKHFGRRLRIGDAFSGMGYIPFAAAELGCDVYASDLNPVACLLTWGALNIVGGEAEYLEEVYSEQNRIYEQIDSWILENGLETSEEGWRAEAYLYCLEIEVPEWDGWTIPISPSWEIAKKFKTWVELIPLEKEKRFDFRVHNGGPGYAFADEGTKQGQDIVLPKCLKKIFKKNINLQHVPLTIPFKQLIHNAGGLRNWKKFEFEPRSGDVLQERLFCIKWRKPDRIDKEGLKVKGTPILYREPSAHDMKIEKKVVSMLSEVFDHWQQKGWIPNWKIEIGAKTKDPINTRGWTFWHHLFTPRQLLLAGYYSKLISECKTNIKPALLLSLGRSLDVNAKLCCWLVTQSGGIGHAKNVFYNQALNPFPNYACRALPGLKYQLQTKHRLRQCAGNFSFSLADARDIKEKCDVWITDPPYADAVKYEELSEFFLAWYASHIKKIFPEWYTDSMRERAVKGKDVSFRVAMSDCYKRLADNMHEDGIQVLMFTHKSTDVWEDLALILWSAGLQIKQVWSVATETAGVGLRTGNYVQATYCMVLRKRISNEIGFIDFITPKVNRQVQKTITLMRDSQIEGELAECGYTDTDYLLAAQAIAAEVITGYSSIDGVDLNAELRIPDNLRGKSALRALMDNAKRTATNYLVPRAMNIALKEIDGGNEYLFWRGFCPEEKFILKSLELEADGVYKIGAFQDLGRAYGLSNYESLIGSAKANNTHTKLPEEFKEPDAIRYENVPISDRNTWKNCPTRHIYHALKLMNHGADVDRAVKHIVDNTDFWNIRANRLSIIIAYLKKTTLSIKHWKPYQQLITSLEISVHHWKA